MTGVARIAISQAENIADCAVDLVDNNRIASAGIDRKLVNVYLTHNSPRSIRKANALVEKLIQFISKETELSSLRRVQILRCIVQYFATVGDWEQRDRFLLPCLQIVRTEGFYHQYNELVRENGEALKKFLE